MLRWLIEGLLPQVAVNRLLPAEPPVRKDGRPGRVWRWLYHPLTREQTRWVAERAAEYGLRWFIAWAMVVWLSVKLGPPWGALLYLLFAAVGGWTLVGVAVAWSRWKRHGHREELDG